jgi:hypothetical protein
LLFMVVADLQLAYHKDEIGWRCTRDGKFTVASAYIY